VSLNLLTLFFFALYDSRFTQTLFLDSSIEINPENPLTLIRVFYNYFLTDNPDLHAVLGFRGLQGGTRPLRGVQKRA
jgi:hypothetical protein